MTTQENVPLVYETFRVVETHREDKSYYIVRMKTEGIADDYCWCSANQPLALGDLIEGYLHSLPDLSKIPTLVIKQLQ